MSYVFIQQRHDERCPKCAWPKYKIIGIFKEAGKKHCLRKCEACFTEWRGRISRDDRDPIREYGKQKQS